MEEALKVRDAADSGRKTAPLQVAADAQVIETDTLSAEDVLAQALAFARRRLGQ